MKLKSILMATAIMMLTSCGLIAQNSKNSKTLVMYFSWVGTTEKMAKMISSSNGGELFRIEPTKAYPTSYTPCTEVVKEGLVIFHNSGFCKHAYKVQSSVKGFILPESRFHPVFCKYFLHPLSSYRLCRKLLP